MTADYIAFHASERPEAVAVIDRGRKISYAEFSRDASAFTRAVRELGLQPGSSVAVACRDFYVHWLLLLAFERLGVATASYLGDEGPGCAPLLESVDLVLSEPYFDVRYGKQRYLITPEWLQSIFALGDAGMSEAASRAPADPLRILRTSGTTGLSKRLLLSRRMYEAWIDRWIWSLGITPASRCLLTMPFRVTGIYTLATAVIRSGGTVVSDVFETSLSVAQALSAVAITHVVVLPIELKMVLDVLPDDFIKPANLTLCTIGAAVAETLREKALARLASDMIVFYGSNEVPFIAEMRSSGSEGPGTVFPWVQAEVVDDHGHPLPPGNIGRVRLKADAMASGYLDDPEATAAMFRDGWFYPGDLGILVASRQLQLIGRHDELLNIGGQKFPPSAVEGLILKHATVGDVGVCSVRNSAGIEEICIAVSKPGHGDQELLERVARALQTLKVGRFHIAKVSRIPRNANGKIERKALRDAVAAIARPQ